MNATERLTQLPADIVTSFSSDFIFLIHPDRIQHFPARNWSPAEITAALQERLGQYTLTAWQNYLVAVATDKELLAVIPRYHSPAEFQTT